MDGKTKRVFRIVGFSAQSMIDRAEACAAFKEGLPKFEIQDFDDPIMSVLSRMIGRRITKESEEMTAFLGKEWSYVREEKFTEGGGLIFKPVRYYLTPKQIFTKLKYDLRDIHSSVWVNMFFNDLVGNPQIVLPVRYPNEADGIINRGGIVVRINNSHSTYAVSKEDLLMDNYKCSYTLDVLPSGVRNTIYDFIWKMKKSNPDVFTTP